jgi:hypothetical protein
MDQNFYVVVDLNMEAHYLDERLDGVWKSLEMALRYASNLRLFYFMFTTSIVIPCILL